MSGMTYYYDAAGCRGVSNHGPLNQDWSRGLWSNPQISSVVVNTFFQVSRPRPRPVTDELESSRDSRPWSRDHMTANQGIVKIASRISRNNDEFNCRRGHALA